RADRLEQRVARRDPLQGRVGRDDSLVEGDLAVFTPEAAELGFLSIPDGDEVARHLPDAVNVARRGRRPGLNSGLGGRPDEELLDDLGDEPSLLRLGRLADDG